MAPKNDYTLVYRLSEALLKWHHGAAVATNEPTLDVGQVEFVRATELAVFITEFLFDTAEQQQWPPICFLKDFLEGGEAELP